MSAININDAEERKLDNSRQNVLHRKPLPTGDAKKANTCYSEPLNLLQAWQPLYLRRTVLLAFALVFLALIVVVQVLLLISDRNQGIASSDSRLHYLWTFGPPAILTILAAFWARTDFHSKLVAPWVHLARGFDTADRTLLLDYLSPLPPSAIKKALRNQDFAVAAATAGSLVFSVMIVLSAGLITLSAAGCNGDVAATVTSRFVDDRTRLKNHDSMITAAFQATLDGRTTRPDGLTERFAYQTVKFESASGRDEIHTTLDAFSSSLHCESASIESVRLLDTAYLGLGVFPVMEIQLHSEGCSLGLVDYSPAMQSFDPGTESSLFGRLEYSHCGMTISMVMGYGQDAPIISQQDDQMPGWDDYRIVLVFGRFTYSKGSNFSDSSSVQSGNQTAPLLNGTIEESTQLLCKPKYNIGPANMVRNQTGLMRIRSKNEGSAVVHRSVHAWDIVTAGALMMGELNVALFSHSAADGQVDCPRDFCWLLLGGQEQRLRHVLPLFGEEYLHQTATQYFQAYWAFVVRELLMEPVELPLDTEAVFYRNRLLVRPLAAHLLTGLLGVLVLLVASIWFSPSCKASLPRRPGTVLDIAALLSKSQQVLPSLASLGWSCTQRIQNRIKDQLYRTWTANTAGLTTSQSPQFGMFGSASTDSSRDDPTTQRPPSPKTQPVVSHPLARSLLCLALIGVVVTLEATLRKSQHGDGLGDAGSETYLHYTWTVLPAATLSLLGLTLDSLDFQTRGLLPYLNLERRLSLQRTVALDLVDGTAPSLLRTAVRTRTWAAAATILSAWLGSLLTVFSGSIFFVQAFPAASEVQLQGSTIFAPPERDTTNPSDFQLASLVLARNLSFPQFTYEGLAFHGMQLPDTVSSPADSETVISVNTTVPAVRSQLQCRLYDNTSLTSSFTRTFNFSGSSANPINIDIDQEACWKNHSITVTLGAEEPPSSGMFGGSSGCMDRITTFGCSQWLYTWGSFDLAPSPPRLVVFAMGCNETLEVVHVQATFGPDFRIDESHPPAPIESSAHPTDMTADGFSSLDFFFYTLASRSAPPSCMFDEFFSFLATSRYATPLSHLNDSTKAHKVAEAIRFQHGIIRAQWLNSVHRWPLNSTNLTGTNHASGALSYPATVTNTLGQRRVLQDELATRVTQGLLGAALALCLLSWALMPRAAILPRTPTCLASVAALVAGGDLMEYLPREGAVWMSPEELRLRFPAGSRFWMGWKVVPGSDGEEKRFGIWVIVDSEVFRT